MIWIVCNLIVSLISGFVLSHIVPLLYLQMAYLVELAVVTYWYNWMASLQKDHTIKEYLQKTWEAGELHAEFVVTSVASFPIVVISYIAGHGDVVTGAVVGLLFIVGGTTIVSILRKTVWENLDDFDDFSH